MSEAPLTAIDISPDKCVVGIVGAGLMGRGIAQIALSAGYRVHLVDAEHAALEAAVKDLSAAFAVLCEKGRITARSRDDTISRLQTHLDLSKLSSADLVIEAIVESLPAKRALFAELEKLVAADCILASNTSSLLITDIAASCARPGRVAGLHFFSPVPRMRVAEVIAAVQTTPSVVEALVAFTEALGHMAVCAPDSPGFIVNHAGRAYGPEALRILSEGISNPQDIDSILTCAAGFKMGPFELFDLTGLDISHPASESIYRQFYDEPRFRPSQITRQRLSAGRLGRKTGQGFYHYPPGTRAVGADQEKELATFLPGSTVWLAPCATLVRTALVRVAERIGMKVEHADRPSGEALCLVFPIGCDATTYAVRHKLNPERVVAVDPLFSKGAITLMPTPVTEDQPLKQAMALAEVAEQRVIVIGDSPGFVAQRIVACIVNIACDMAQQGIGEPEEIDTAVRLALGYPKGPFEMGDSLGAATVLEILEGLHACYAEPRYRPSAWLKRRAMLDISLTKTQRHHHRPESQ